MSDAYAQLIVNALKQIVEELTALRAEVQHLGTKLADRR
jgi:hypothetical protein